MEMKKLNDPTVRDHWIIYLFLFYHQILDPNTGLVSKSMMLINLGTWSLAFAKDHIIKVLSNDSMFWSSDYIRYYDDIIRFPAGEIL